jgi:hypothetical protein
MILGTAMKLARARLRFTSSRRSNFLGHTHSCDESSSIVPAFDIAQAGLTRPAKGN